MLCNKFGQRCTLPRAHRPGQRAFAQVMKCPPHKHRARNGSFSAGATRLLQTPCVARLSELPLHTVSRLSKPTTQQCNPPPAPIQESRLKSHSTARQIASAPPVPRNTWAHPRDVPTLQTIREQVDAAVVVERLGLEPVGNEDKGLSIPDSQSARGQIICARGSLPTSRTSDLDQFLVWRDPSSAYPDGWPDVGDRRSSGIVGMRHERSVFPGV